MTYYAWGVSKDVTCGPGEEANKKGQKLSRVKLAIYPDHPRRHSPLKFCMRGRVREVVIQCGPQKSKPPPIFQKIVLKIANEIRFLRKVKV